MDHIPRGIPVCECGLEAAYHRPSHNPKGNPTCECGALFSNHRVKHRYTAADNGNCVCGLRQENHHGRGPSASEPYRIQYAFIDGEGIGRRPHRYVLLCAAACDGRHWELENLRGLSTERCLDWILNTLDKCRVFSYSFGYDITCILKDLPNELLYLLLRPSLRYSGRGKLKSVDWKGFSLNWLQGQVIISKGKQRVVIWDIFKFYQCSFVKALEDWNIPVGDIETMKEKRNRFAKKDILKIRAYCIDECIKGANLAKKLIETHKECGLTLKSYYGPGSTASVLLSKLRVLEYLKDPPKAMWEAIACGFFGGRFEHSTMGIIKPVYGYDISSAYPYELYHLPCLRHGKWKHVKKDVGKAIRNCTTAIVHIQHHGPADEVWAPFPVRDPDGSICYPRISEGWYWLPEVQAAIDGGWQVTLIEAWVYYVSCRCHPFQAIADYYILRNKYGKDGAGKIYKLGPNSCYGKLAQSKGPNPRYQCWIWAGLVTSGTRGQILRGVGKASHPKQIVAIATDGIYSREPLRLETPRDTGTSHLAKPLGGWEEKVYEHGMLFIKPGIYVALDDQTIRARGIGRKAVLKHKKRLIQAWNRDAKQLTIKIDRFFGAKTSISKSLNRSKKFGQWEKMTIKVAFECPNRAPDMSLLERHEPSAPYSRSLLNREKYDALVEEAIAYEQP